MTFACSVAPTCTLKWVGSTNFSGFTWMPLRRAVKVIQLVRANISRHAPFRARCWKRVLLFLIPGCVDDEKGVLAAMLATILQLVYGSNADKWCYNSGGGSNRRHISWGRICLSSQLKSNFIIGDVWLIATVACQPFRHLSICPEARQFRRNAP